MEWILIVLATILTGLITFKLFTRKAAIEYEGDLFIYSDQAPSKTAGALTRLARESKFRPHILSQEDLSILQLKKQSVAVFICASDSESTYQFIRSAKIPSKQGLPNLAFAVLSLNLSPSAVALDQVLTKLKSRRVTPVTEVYEDSAGIKDWAGQFFETLKSTPQPSPEPSKFLRVVNCVPSNNSKTPDNFSKSAHQLQSSRKSYLDKFVVTKIRDLKKDPEDCAMHIELATSLPYVGASSLAIFPQNDEDTVRLLAGLQDYDLEDTICFSSDKPHPFPTPTTLLNAFVNYCDLTSLIRKKALKDLSEFAEDPSERQRLEFLASLKGKEEFRSVIQEPMLSVLDILNSFPSVKVPPGILVQILDHIQPRFYSISSSPLAYPDSIHLTVQLTKDKTCEGKTKMGLCSGYFHKMFISGLYTPVRGFFQNGVFSVSPDISKLYLIAIGSAIAPFRAIIQEIQQRRPIETYLIYGCKNRHSRFVYKKEIENAIFPSEEEPEEHEYRPGSPGEGPFVLNKAYCAFSDEGHSPAHVQDVMLTHQEKLWRSLEGGATFFVCGSNAMAKNVLNLIETIAAEHVEDPKQFIATMVQSKKIVMEMWG